MPLAGPAETPVDTAPTTRTASVYEALRADLLSGKFAPDARLAISSLAELYGTGATPIREVLNRLSAEGFVVQIDQRGFRAPPFNVRELEELTRTRCLLNEVVVREAVRNATEATDEAVVLAHHRLTRVSPRDAAGPNSFNPEWEKLHHLFHRALIAPCGSRWLVDLDSRLFEQSTRYRLLSGRPDSLDRDVAGEHGAIMSAFLDRDADRALALLNDHISETARMARSGRDAEG